MTGKNAELSIFLLFLLMLGIFTTGCSGETPQEETAQSQESKATRSEAEIDIDQIEIRTGDRIVFSGTTTIPQGECVFSQLFEDRQPAVWWPSDQCFSIPGPDWQFAVALGEDGVPEALDDSVQYRLQVWWAGAPEETADEIYFDLAGPQSP